MTTTENVVSLNEFAARRAERLTVTRTGLVIGSAYTPPPPAHSNDADAIQAALLRRVPDSMWAEERESRWLWIVYAAGLVGALLITHFCARCSAA